MSQPGVTDCGEIFCQGVLGHDFFKCQNDRREESRNEHPYSDVLMESEDRHISQDKSDESIIICAVKEGGDHRVC